MAFTFDNLVRIPEESNLCFRPLEPKVEAELYLSFGKNFRCLPNRRSCFLKPCKKIFEQLYPIQKGVMKC